MLLEWPKSSIEWKHNRHAELHPRVPQQYLFGECGCLRAWVGGLRTKLDAARSNPTSGRHTLAVRLQCTAPALREWSPIRPRLAGEGAPGVCVLRCPHPALRADLSRKVGEVHSQRHASSQLNYTLVTTDRAPISLPQPEPPRALSVVCGSKRQDVTGDPCICRSPAS
jgi:hypothetical protein